MQIPVVLHVTMQETVPLTEVSVKNCFFFLLLRLQVGDSINIMKETLKCGI